MKKSPFRLALTAGLLASFIIYSTGPVAQPATYKAGNGAITGFNTGRFNNRPQYINNTNAFVLAGDQPVIRLVKDQFIYGTFMLGIIRDGSAKWIHDCNHVTSKYYPGRMEWDIADSSLPGMKLSVETVPADSLTGMAIRIKAITMRKGDSLFWAFGGSQHRKNQNLSWKLDIMGQPELLAWDFSPEECSGNQVKNKGDKIQVSLNDSLSGKKLFTVYGSCNHTGITQVGDASRWKEAVAFLSSVQGSYPLLNGKFPLKPGAPVYWSMKAINGDMDSDFSGFNQPEADFQRGLERSKAFQDRLRIDTPDPCLDALAQASVAAVDGTWYPPVFHHGGMQWNSRYPGWRTVFGGTMYGWHDRVKMQAGFYLDSQVKESDKTEAKTDPETLMTEQHKDSRYYGKGRILQDQRFYNMQTQLFDQLIEEWRWTADPELEKLLRPALGLHLQWVKDCFDPDGDGLYESYISTWPSDSQWYNGGGSAEETSYAYKGHEAARDMARRAGDEKSAAFHSAMIERIRRGFMNKLWLRDKGHSGSYLEQGGHERVHTDPWLYSIFLPVDARLTDPIQSVESVYYSEWALQNDRMPMGGRRVWTSNWVPGIWSVRENWPGDNYHLAQAYFQAGLPDDGWDVFRGTFLSTAFGHTVPGNLGAPAGGTDFGDCTHPFARTLVQGLFGYYPDYPNGRVRINPQFPSDWDHASIELPDFKLGYKKNQGKVEFRVELKKPAKLHVRIPVHTKEIRSVKVNDKPVEWVVNPWPGCSVIDLELPELQIAEIVIETGSTVPIFPPEYREGNLSENLRLELKDAEIVKYYDPQSILADGKIDKNTLTGKLTGKQGYHTLVAEVKTGSLPQWRIYRIKINDPAGDAIKQSKHFQNVPEGATFEKVDLSPYLNADLRTIYQQKYLSPRPNTVSLRLGIDGYSPWTFPHWKSLPPEIKFDQVKHLLRKDELLTTQKVPFIWYGSEKNVAFTSLWDNYPDKITFPVHKKGEAAWFLVSGSTNVMQCRIANAVIRMKYADGKTDSLELIPPVNFWNLSTIDSHATAPGQFSRNDYTAETDRFCLPLKFPETVQLGENCRAMLLNLKLREDMELESVTLETLSQEVVIGMMGITIMLK